MELELNQYSEKIDHPLNINIELKEHQLAIIKRCIQIENDNICNFGIMNDKPGTGKTYAILSLILLSKKRNIIIVPQNIIGQWCNSINLFSNGLLKYKKVIEYSDILDIYSHKSIFENNIILTTSLFYNSISTTMEINNINVDRIIFDEIDSISSFLVHKINANFIWFVSASFNYTDLGIYTGNICEELLPLITCKCDNKYIDENLKLKTPTIYKIICKNIYLDTIFDGIFSYDEYKLLNAMDYSALKKKFCNKIAQTEKEALEYIVKDQINNIEMEKLRIIDLEKIIQNNSYFNVERLNNAQKQLETSKLSLEKSENKLNLIKERLKENNFCPLCYNEFIDTDKKVISTCCKNTICYECADNWFSNLKKTNCIYCNIPDIKFEDYIILLNENNDNNCILCNTEYKNNDEKYYAKCCNKTACSNCLKEWYHKLIKQECLFCNNFHTLFEDFKNEKQYDEMKLNEQSGVKYTRKTKIDFIEYFIKTKIYANCKIIFCSSYIRIFNSIKNLFIKYNVRYIELDDGNIENIKTSIYSYTDGNINVILLNSNLFGCGLNLECTTDIVFLHKTEADLEEQIIGRAQRLGRKNSLNIWKILHENENIIKTKKNSTFEQINIDVNNYFLDSDPDTNIKYNDQLFNNYEMII